MYVSRNQQVQFRWILCPTPFDPLCSHLFINDVSTSGRCCHHRTDTGAVSPHYGMFIRTHGNKTNALWSHYIDIERAKECIVRYNSCATFTIAALCMVSCCISPCYSDTRAHFLSLAPSKLRLCSANRRAGYFSNLACDWLSIVWAYSEQERENGPRAPSQYRDDLSRYGDFHYKEKMIVRPSFLYNGNPHTAKTSSYWEGPLPWVDITSIKRLLTNSF